MASPPEAKGSIKLHARLQKQKTIAKAKVMKSQALIPENSPLGQDAYLSKVSLSSSVHQFRKLQAQVTNAKKYEETLRKDMVAHKTRMESLTSEAIYEEKLVFENKELDIDIEDMRKNII